jgi:pimeloyl-ACP methyl ester carboxylesterase
VTLPSLPGVNHRTVTVAAEDGGLDLHVAEAGGGPPLLLLHGWPQHWWVWRRVIPLLSGAHRLLVPDLRGFGWSAAPGRGTESATFASDAIALLDALELERVGVVGHDWGGFTAYLLGLRHPDRVTGLVCCNTPHPWAAPGPRAVASLWRTWYVGVLASPAGARIMASERFLAALVRAGARGAFDEETAALYAARLREPARAHASQQLYRSYLRTAARVYLRREFGDRRLAVPTRALFGTEDFYVPLASALGAERHVGDYELRLLPGCGHWTPEERPTAVAETARALFDGLGGGG